MATAILPMDMVGLTRRIMAGDMVGEVEDTAAGAETIMAMAGTTGIEKNVIKQVNT